MYKFLLENNDKIKRLAADQILDLKDYIYMRNKVLPAIVKWDAIKSYWVTDNGVTLWQLSEKYLNSEQRAIGTVEPPCSLIQWILSENY